MDFEDTSKILFDHVFKDQVVKEPVFKEQAKQQVLKEHQFNISAAVASMTEERDSGQTLDGTIPELSTSNLAAALGLDSARGASPGNRLLDSPKLVSAGRGSPETDVPEDRGQTDGHAEQPPGEDADPYETTAASPESVASEVPSPAEATQESLENCQENRDVSVKDTVTILVPEGVREDRLTRFIYAGEVWVAEVPDGTCAGDQVTVSLERGPLLYVRALQALKSGDPSSMQREGSERHIWAPAFDPIHEGEGLGAQ